MSELFELRGTSVLITGSQGNFAPIFAETLQNAGAMVRCAGLPEYDVTDSVHREEIVEMYDAEDDVPNVLICNAAIDTPPTVETARFFSRFEETLKVNLTAHALLIERFLPRFVSRNRVYCEKTRIVLIGSIQGYIGADWRNYEGGFEKPVAYNLSKAAFQQLARSITVQYGRYGITAVCPGFGPYLSDKLPAEFREKIVEKIPTRNTVSRRSLEQTILYACCCEDLAGEDWLVDGGYTKW